MQVEGTRVGEKGTSSTNNIYLDQDGFDTLVENMNASAANMTIPDEAFDNYKAAKGTDSIKKMNSKWKKIQKMTNRYKEFLSLDVSIAYAEATKRIIEANQESGDAINSIKSSGNK